MTPIDPQSTLSKFWSNYHPTTPEKVLRVFPPDLYKTLRQGTMHTVPVMPRAYKVAAQKCRSDVRDIVKECRRTNSKFSDSEFSIDQDFSSHDHNCLFGIVRPEGEAAKPGAVHRIPWIFDDPKFVADTFNMDIKQGSSRNCWWLAALSAVSRHNELMEKVCVARDEECGVYGFVFYRDGGWISTVVDDNLYLTEEDFDEDVYDSTGKKAKAYRMQKQTGSNALFFAKCGTANETWVPLLEKAYAKVHGDYASLDYGWAGTAVEDLTGGITTVIRSDRLLRSERLWRDFLRLGEGDFLFNLSTGDQGDNYRNGLILRHDYSVVEAIQVEDEVGNLISLVKIRNPWGQRCPTGHGDWSGPWSDGSEEWTPFMMEKLHHKFRDDGTFWMTFQDMIESFPWIYRTRLFDDRWSTTQKWMNVSVPWLGGYLKKRFVFELETAGTVILVLSQLDDRYFRDLKGQYEFTLYFTLKPMGIDIPICEVLPVHHLDRRSVNCEVELEPGIYEVIPKVLAERDEGCMPTEEMVSMAAYTNPNKLRQVGKAYDLAHSSTQSAHVDSQDKCVYRLFAPNSMKPKFVHQMSGEPQNGGRYGATGFNEPEPGTDSDSGPVSEAGGSNAKSIHSREQPWNAVCTIGLRVLVHASAGVTLSVGS